MNKKGAIIIEGHVQGLANTRALGEKGIPVYVIDVCPCLAQYSKYCKKYFRCPIFSTPDFIDFLINLGKKEHLEGWVLIPSNDHIVEQLSYHKEELQPYFQTIVPSVEILQKIINKKHLLEVAEECGTPYPSTCYISTQEKAQTMCFPLLIKGNLGLSFYKATHQKAIQVNDIEAMHNVLASLQGKVEEEDVMIQELIPFDPTHKVVSFTCFAEEGEIRTYWMGDKLREHPIKYGTATYARSILLPEILEHVRPLIKTLGYTGVCEVEFLRDPRDGVYKLIEINPRTWLWVGLAKACGVDYAHMLYCYLNKLPIDYPQTYIVGVKWINWVTDTVFAWGSILKGVLSVKEYFQSLGGKKVKAIFSWHDIMPGLAFVLLSFYIAKKRS